jgi:hypothetical protein
LPHAWPFWSLLIVACTSAPKKGRRKHACMSKPAVCPPCSRQRHCLLPPPTRLHVPTTNTHTIPSTHPPNSKTSQSREEKEQSPGQNVACTQCLTQPVQRGPIALKQASPLTPRCRTRRQSCPSSSRVRRGTMHAALD